MKYLPLVWAGLWRRPLRTILTFLSIVVAFLLLGVLVALVNHADELMNSTHLDRLMVFSRFGKPLQESYIDQIEQLPGVMAAAPFNVVMGYVHDPKSPLGVNGTNAKAAMAIFDDFHITQEQLETWEHTRTGVIVSSATAEKYGWKVGDQIVLNSKAAQKNGSTAWSFDIVAVFDVPAGWGDFVYANFDYIDQARGTGNGTANYFYVHIADATQAEQTSVAVDDLFVNSPAPTRTTPEKAFGQSMQQSLGDMHFFVTAVGGAVLFMLLFLTGNNAMQAVRERIPEFGIMKAIGFSDDRLLTTVLAESAAMFAIGTLVGLGAAKIIASHDKSRNLMMQMSLPWRIVAIAFGFAIVAAVASALIPAWRVKRLSVVDALAGR